MVETDRQGLVAGLVGKPRSKPTRRSKKPWAVYSSLTKLSLTAKTGGAHGDFGDEAIQTLLKRMEDMRGQFFVFVAGYTDNMETFLKANPGLNSRFDKMLRFEDYMPDELLQIAMHAGSKWTHSNSRSRGIPQKLPGLPLRLSG
nr:hypothetical protein [Haliscomenobacter sp.]